jgi:hypothetical protein
MPEEQNILGRQVVLRPAIIEDEPQILEWLCDQM